MHPPVPTRITIELRPAPEDGTWTAAARVGAPDAHPGLAGPMAAELREPMPGPAGYEPSDCTCHAGLCNEDHANA